MKELNTQEIKELWQKRHSVDFAKTKKQVQRLITKTAKKGMDKVVLKGKMCEEDVLDWLKNSGFKISKKMFDNEYIVFLSSPKPYWLFIPASCLYQCPYPDCGAKSERQYNYCPYCGGKVDSKFELSSHRKGEVKE